MLFSTNLHKFDRPIGKDIPSMLPSFILAFSISFMLVDVLFIYAACVVSGQEE